MRAIKKARKVIETDPTSKKYLVKQIGQLLLGIALIFISLKLMQQAMESTLPFFKLDTFLYAGGLS